MTSAGVTLRGFQPFMHEPDRNAFGLSAFEAIPTTEPNICLAGERQFDGCVAVAALTRARWRAAFALLPQDAMSHQRRRPARDSS